MSGSDNLSFSFGAREGTFLYWLETRVLPSLVRLAGAPIVIAIQDGVMTAIPFIIVGFAIFFWFPPDKYYFHQSAIQMGPLVGGLFGAEALPHDVKWQALEAFRAGLGFMCLWVSFRTAWKLRKLQGGNGLISGGLSLLLFSLTFPTEPLGTHDLFLYLAQGGLFVAILLSWGLTSLLKWLEQGLVKDDTEPGLYGGAAPFLAFSFMALGIFLLMQVLDWISARLALPEPLQIHSVVYMGFLPLLRAGDSPFVLFVILSMVSLTLMGVHGSGVIGSIVLPLYFTLLEENAHAANHGLLPPHIVTPSFMHWCFLGGSGCTLPLCFLMLQARSKRLRKVARVSLLPSLCNINETLQFGIPLIMNPMTAIPFLLNPVLLGLIHYIELYYGLLHRTILYAPFMIPTPIGMWIASGGDWRSLIVCAVDFVVAGVVWWPFFKAFDAKTAAQEEAEASLVQP